jgi:hypothetical protein
MIKRILLWIVALAISLPLYWILLKIGVAIERYMLTHL